MADLKADLAALRIDRPPERSRSRAARWLALVVIAVALAAAGWLWASRDRPLPVATVSAVERAPGAQAEVLKASGYVTARRRATISSKITGKVVEVNVEEGMSVREGQVLARLDDRDIRAALALAEAQVEAARRAVAENEVRLAEARVTLRRTQQLLKDGVATPAELDTAQAQVDSLAARLAASQQEVAVAERRVEVQQAELDNTIIRAPFGGVAISKDAQPGEMVSPVSAGGGFTRTGICTVVDMSSLEIEVDVNEAYINRVRPGQRTIAVLDAYPEWEIPSRVITTIPAADRQKATVLVRVAFDRLDPRILPDMGVDVRFLRDDPEPAAGSDGTARGPVVLVPKSAVRTDGDRTLVFVVSSDTAERRAVTLGGAEGDLVEVLAGLGSGEQVVAPVPEGLRDGARVTAVR